MRHNRENFKWVSRYKTAKKRVQSACNEAQSYMFFSHKLTHINFPEAMLYTSIQAYSHIKNFICAYIAILGYILYIRCQYAASFFMLCTSLIFLLGKYNHSIDNQALLDLGMLYIKIMCVLLIITTHTTAYAVLLANIDIQSIILAFLRICIYGAFIHYINKQYRNIDLEFNRDYLLIAIKLVYTAIYTMPMYIYYSKNLDFSSPALYACVIMNMYLAIQADNLSKFCIDMCIATPVQQRSKALLITLFALNAFVIIIYPYIEYEASVSLFNQLLTRCSTLIKTICNN